MKYRKVAIMVVFIMIFSNMNVCNALGNIVEKDDIYVIDLSDDVVVTDEAVSLIDDVNTSGGGTDIEASEATSEEATEVTTEYNDEVASGGAININSPGGGGGGATNESTTEETTSDFEIKGESSDILVIEEYTVQTTEEEITSEKSSPEEATEAATEEEITEEAIEAKSDESTLEESTLEESTEAANDESTTEEATETTTEANVEIADTVYIVNFPTSVKAYLDPENLSGLGEIFSQKYQIANYGNTDVAIKINNIDVIYNFTQELYEFSDEAVEEDGSDKKIMNIQMIWDNKNENIEKVLDIEEGKNDEYVIYLKAAKYDENGNFVEINPAGRGEFYFSGSINSNHNINWFNGELSVNFGYSIIDAEKESNKDDIKKFIESVDAILDESKKDENEEEE